jgi:hypothetical protein
VYITSVFKDNKLVRRPKTVEIEVYLAAFAFLWKDPYTDPDPYKYIRFWIRDA